MVRYHVAERVATITLNRPERLNAWTGRMHTEYRGALEPGRGRSAACGWWWSPAPDAGSAPAPTRPRLSGHVERGGYDPGTADDLARPGYGVAPEFDHDFAFHFGLTKPVIAAVNGPAAGRRAGAGLLLRPALRGDRRQADHRARQAQPARRVRPVVAAAPPDRTWAGPTTCCCRAAWCWPRRRWALGLVNAVVEPDDLLDHTYAYADALAHAVSAGSLAATKRQIYARPAPRRRRRRSTSPADGWPR